MVEHRAQSAVDGEIEREQVALVNQTAAPDKRAEFLSRATLDGARDRAFGHRLTTITGPLGAGKSTIAGQWADAATMPVARLTVDREDNDAERLRERLAGAIDAALQRSAVERRCSRSAAAAQQQLFVIVDDIHLLESDASCHALAETLLTGDMPLHVLLCGRSIPRLPMGILQIRRDFQALGMKDLAFSCEEAIALAEIIAPEGSGDQVRRVRAVMDGWLGDLLPGLGDADPEQPVDALVDDLLAEHPVGDHDFILALSLPDRLSPDLALALAGGSRSLPELRTLLDRLLQFGLLVNLEGPEVGWFAMPGPLRTAMARALEARSTTAEILRLHESAYRWFLGEDRITSAVHHARTAGLPAEAVDLLKRSITPTLTLDDWRSVETWPGMFPRDIVESNPRLVRAENPLSDPTAQRMLAEFSILRTGNSVLFDTDHEPAPGAIQRALAETPQGERMPCGLGQCLSNQEIADAKAISLHTVKSQVSSIFGKLGVSSRREVIVAAQQYDLSGLDR